MGTTSRNIIIADDNIQFRTNLKIYIENELGHNVIAEASNGKDFLECLKKFDPDIVLLDIVMDEMDGIEAAKRALRVNSYLKMIAITIHTEKVYLLQLMQSGFKGCVFKSDIYDQLAIAIEDVMEGKFFIPKDINLLKK